MDSSPCLWISEMELDNSIFAGQSDFMDSIDPELAAILRQDLEACLSPRNNLSSSPSLINIPSTTNSITSLCKKPPQLDHEPPTKLHKPNNFSNISTIQKPHHLERALSSAPVLINFGNENPTENSQQGINSRPLNPDEEAAVNEVLKSQVSPTSVEEQSKTVQKGSQIRLLSQNYDHIIAERKRREQLSQRFVALSTIVPGLKKMDKTSILGDAIKYLKHLQVRVKLLEERQKKQTMESVVLVKKSQINMVDDDEGASDDEERGSSDMEHPLPEIEARVCNNHILIRVHCQRQRGILVNLLSKVESLSLSVINSNVTPFGTLAIDITIIAEMEKEFNLTVKDVVKRLRAALRHIE